MAGNSHDVTDRQGPPIGRLDARPPVLTFGREQEAEFRRAHLEENLGHIRANLCLGVVVCVAFSASEAPLLGPQLNRIPGMIHLLVMIPALIAALAASYSPRRQRLYPAMALGAALALGVCLVGIHLLAALAGAPMLFPSLVLAAIFIYFMMGLGFQQALGANAAMVFLYLGAGTALELPGREFGYDALVLVVANLFAGTVVYRQEKIGRLRFLEAGLLRDLVARDALTGIQNRRMFDDFIVRTWEQASREGSRVAVLLVDIDCFKDFNDRYGHQAGDECLRAVATSLARCARRPLDFAARYGGEEFALILHDASREYVAEVSTRIQRSVAELNIAHEASRVASRLTVSIGAALTVPTATRTHEGLIQLADEALYAAKEQGRNRVVVMESEYHSLTTGRFQKRRAQGAGRSAP